MFFNTSKVDVWAAPMDDQPGGLATRLEALAMAGANLEVILARRDPDDPGKGVVFVTPLVGAAQVRAAETSGFRRADTVHTIRIDGPDQPGLGYLLTRTLAAAGLSHRGMTAITLRGQFIAYISFGCGEDATRAIARLQVPL